MSENIPQIQFLVPTVRLNSVLKIAQLNCFYLTDLYNRKRNLPRGCFVGANEETTGKAGRVHTFIYISTYNKVILYYLP